MAFYFLAGAPVPGRIPSLLHHRALEHHRAPAAVMADWHTRATEALAAKAKPAGSLGLLEEWAAVLCTVQQTLAPVAEPQSVLVFCGDHGVKRADQSLSPFPPSVSQAVFRSLCAGISATAVLARTAGAHLAVVDVGLDGDVSDQRADANHSISVLHQKVACGTADFRTAPAMDEAELSRAIEVGRSAVAGEVSARQARVVAVGEVGIGNTTAAAALLASLTGASPADCCGRGTGLDDGGLRHKEETVARACEAHSEPLRSAGPLCGASRAREALRRVGGLELAAMTGAFLEAEERGVTIVYCTHIFDGLDDWPTHIAYVSKGKLEFCKPMAELATLLVAPPAQAARGWGRLFCAVQRLLLQLSPEFESRLRGPAPPPPPPAADPSAAVSIRGLRWGYSGGGRAALAGVELSVARGSRSLLVGANGAGKTTLLRLIGGKHMVADGQLHVLGREAFGDTKLNTLVSMLSGDWTRQAETSPERDGPRELRAAAGPSFSALSAAPSAEGLHLALKGYRSQPLHTHTHTHTHTHLSHSSPARRQVACVGSGVPFQADFSVGFMAKAFADSLVRDGLPQSVVSARLERLTSLLDLDFEWRLHKVSDGQRRRAQLLLKLLRPSELLLLDEVTTDLDVLSRQALLQFLREETEQRGASATDSDDADEQPSS